MTATHDIEKFWEHMRRVHASPRPPMTDEQRRRQPPVTHPVFLTLPITGRKRSTAIPALPSGSTNCHSAKATRYSNTFSCISYSGNFDKTNVWAENDLLIWDHLGTLHRAIADYALEKNCCKRALKARPDC